jgi:hypothetical protein
VLSRAIGSAASADAEALAQIMARLQSADDPDDLLI